MMKSVPNQRIVTINKERCDDKDKKNYYAKINLSAIDIAANDLVEKASFKLWIYLSKNAPNYTFALSSADFCSWARVGMTAYRTAFSELVDKCYLIKANGNSYEFHEKPVIPDERVTIIYPANKVESYVF